MNDNAIRTKKTDERSGTWFLFSLEGRISRKPFWIFVITVSLGALVVGYFEGATINIKEVNDAQKIYLFTMLWPSVAVLGKRWHDRNRSATWVLLFPVPFVGQIWTLIEAGFMPGTPGPNEYGPDPTGNSRKKISSDNS